MKRLLEEYGRLIIAIICASSFFVVLGVLLSDENTKGSLTNKFDKYEQDSTDLYKEDYLENTIGNKESDKVPYYNLYDNNGIKITGNTSIALESSIITYDNLVNHIKIIYKDEDITNKTKTKDGKDISKKIFVYKYTPRIIKNENDINGHIEMEEVYVTDKYGHFIYEEDGKTKIKINQPKLDIAQANIENNQFVNINPEASIIDIVYRVQVGTYKAESTLRLVKDANTKYEEDLIGLTKVNFTEVK